jgi:HEAT repeat protein
VLCRSKNVTDAYRAVLAWARHATDAGGRPGSIRAEASDRLGRMLRGDRMLQYVVDQACSAKGLASVQAIQVMMAVGPTVVPRVLEKLGNTTGDARSQAAGVLIAMGEAAFPSLVDELTAPEPERVRRAARLLGEMQNPRGVDYLVEHLDYADPMVKKEVARALVQIGTERAMDAVARGLEGDEGTAEIAAAALGCASPTDGVVRALLRVAEGNTSHSLVVRREAIRSLGRVGDARALPLLAALLEQRALFGRKRNRMLRVVAAQAIGRIGGEEAYRLLDAHTRGGDSAVRQACSDALRMLERAAQA